MGENEKPEELPRPGKNILNITYIVSIEIYLFYAINGFTVAVILTIFYFLKQTSDTEVVRKNLQVGIYMFSYLGLLILLTLLLFKELHKHLLTSFYEVTPPQSPDTENNLTTSQGRLLKNIGPTP